MVFNEFVNEVRDPGVGGFDGFVVAGSQNDALNLFDFGRGTGKADAVRSGFDIRRAPRLDQKIFCGELFDVFRSCGCAPGS